MTIYDIAKLAGVSKSTVSRVLNGETNVSTDARLKVEKVIRENNYTPNRSASMTKKNRQVILVLATRLDSYSETRLIRGMMEHANEEVEFLITETQFSIDKTKQIISSNKNVSAIIIFAISGQDYDFIEQTLMPVVIIGQKITTSKHNVYFNDYDSMNQLVAMNKSEKALFIGYDATDKTMVTRYQAATDALGYNVDRIETDVYNEVPDLSNVRLSDYDVFISTTDYQALNVYKHLITQQHSNYKILSSGNNLHINFVIDNLQTISFHYKQVGKYVIEHLNDKAAFSYVPPYTIK
ncbi:LacI family DNA-binding transcriptional regulator [Mollicutes bacterium LVI A0039]|nr:LacI family DNA-binding transcriptional regulator [Mollicutes bacterium LVI A0039]